MKHPALERAQHRPVVVSETKRPRFPAFVGRRGKVVSVSSDPFAKRPPILVRFPGMTDPVRFFAHELHVPDDGGDA